MFLHLQPFLTVTIAVALLCALAEKAAPPPVLIPFLTPSLITIASPSIESRGLMITGSNLELPTLPAGLSQNIKLLPGCSSTLL